MSDQHAKKPQDWSTGNTSAASAGGGGGGFWVKVRDNFFDEDSRVVVVASSGDAAVIRAKYNHPDNVITICEFRKIIEFVGKENAEGAFRSIKNTSPPVFFMYNHVLTNLGEWSEALGEPWINSDQEWGKKKTKVGSVTSSMVCNLLGVSEEAVKKLSDESQVIAAVSSCNGDSAGYDVVVAGKARLDAYKESLSTTTDISSATNPTAAPNAPSLPKPQIFTPYAPYTGHVNKPGESKKEREAAVRKVREDRERKADLELAKKTATSNPSTVMKKPATKASVIIPKPASSQYSDSSSQYTGENSSSPTTAPPPPPPPPSAAIVYAISHQPGTTNDQRQIVIQEVGQTDRYIITAPAAPPAGQTMVTPTPNASQLLKTSDGSLLTVLPLGAPPPSAVVSSGTTAAATAPPPPPTTTGITPTISGSSTVTTGISTAAASFSPTSSGGQLQTATGTTTSAESAKLTVTVVDPLNQKLQVPLTAIFPTRGSTRPPHQGNHISLCLLNLEGRCRQGAECNQIHANPAVIAELRTVARNTPLCCQYHKEANAHEFEQYPDWRRRQVTVELSPAQQMQLPFDRFAFTSGLRRCFREIDHSMPISNDFAAPLVLKADLICQLHYGGNCRFREDCKFVHLCRDFTAQYLSNLIQPRVESNAVATSASLTRSSAAKRQQQQGWYDNNNKKSGGGSQYEQYGVSTTPTTTVVQMAPGRNIPGGSFYPQQQQQQIIVLSEGPPPQQAYTQQGGLLHTVPAGSSVVQQTWQ